MLTVLIVTADGSSFAGLAEPFLAEGHVVHEAFRSSALSSFQMTEADVVVIHLDEGQAMKLAGDIRELPTGDMCVIIGVGRRGSERCPTAFDCIVPEPDSPQGLTERLRRLDRDWSVRPSEPGRSTAGPVLAPWVRH